MHKGKNAVVRSADHPRYYLWTRYSRMAKVIRQRSRYDISTLTTEPSSSTAVIDVDQGGDFIDSELKAIDRLVECFEF